MRVLLDEWLPRRLKHELVGHEARTGPEMRWASKRNGELLRVAVAAQGAQIIVFVAFRLQHHDSDVEYRQVLLVLEFSIDCQERIEARCRRCWKCFQPHQEGKRPS